VELDLVHLERGGMAMTHQIIDEPLILADPPRAAPVGDAGGLHDRRIIAHVVDDPNEAVIEHRQRFIKNLFKRWYCDAPRRPRLVALCGDLVFLLRFEPHLTLLSYRSLRVRFETAQICYMA
jgi:hypothetical protein